MITLLAAFIGLAMTTDDIRLLPGEHGALGGQTGTGKSYLALNGLIPKTGRLCILDPKQEIDAKALGLKVFTRPFSVRFWQPDRFIYRPTPELVNDVAAYDDVIRYCFDRRDFFLYVDDMVGIMDKNAYPPYLRKCYHLGRSRGVSVLAAFQRPAWIPQFMLTECKRHYVFDLPKEEDGERMAAVIGDYDYLAIPDDYVFYYYYIRERGQRARMLKYTKDA